MADVVVWLSNQSPRCMTGTVQIDSTPITYVILAIVVVTCILFQVIMRLRQRARSRSLQEYASSIGFAFHLHGDPSIDPWYERFEVFRIGRSRRAFNTLSGEIETATARIHVIMGDFRYVIERGVGKDRRRTVRKFSYLISQSPWRNAPELLIRPEGMKDRFFAFFGAEDIDFESDSFSRAFFVRSPDRKFAYDLIDHDMMDFLMETRPPLIDLEEGALCLCTSRGQWEVEEFRRKLDWVGGFFAKWPSHLVKRLSGEAP